VDCISAVGSILGTLDYKEEYLPPENVGAILPWVEEARRLACKDGNDFSKTYKPAARQTLSEAF